MKLTNILKKTSQTPRKTWFFLASLLSILLLTFLLLDTPVFAEEGGAEEGTQVEHSVEAGGEGEAEVAPQPVGDPAPKLTAESYTTFWGISPRITVWIVAQLHLFFAAFVLGVPIFVLCIEGYGMASGDQRYDQMAREFMKISLVAFSFTATLGGILLFSLLIFYPDFTVYSLKIFKPIMIVYAFLFFVESIFLYIYYYGWDALSQGDLKWVHLTIGLLLNCAGMTLMVLSNSWVTFMMAPSGIAADGAFLGNIWDVVKGPLWNPVNLHRFIANIAYGGSIVGAYAAFKFLTSKNDTEKAHYDWMGYTANFIAVIGLIPLPFAGYWLTKEIYAYSQQMGITLMGGIFAWLFIIQALLIGALFLGVNYYLWIGLGRIQGGERYRPAIKFIAFVLAGAFLVWFTPHTMVMTGAEIKALGGAHHPILGFFGVMSAKNTAVNIMISTTFLSFFLYRRAGKKPTVSWAQTGNIAITALFLAGAINIISLGVYGYVIPANIRIGLSIPQVCTTLSIVIIASIIDAFMYRGATSMGPTTWGKMPGRSQYALLLLAVSFTWLMGLMGYVRSGIRQHWHVYTIFRDYSPEAFTPTLGFAAKVITSTTIIFFCLVVFIFWLDMFSKKKAGGKA